MARARPVVESDVLDDQLCFDLYAASRAMTRHYRPFLERFALTYPQYLVVLVLGGRGASTIKELAGILRLDHATLSPVLRIMETRGFVARSDDPDDGRAVRMSLTDRGREVHSHADDISCRMRDDLGLSPDEVRDLQLRLREVVAVLEPPAT